MVKKLSLILFCIAFTLMIFSCSTKKLVVSNTKAARAADAMANLKNKDLYRFINSWTGVKYKLGGMDKQGIDCSGFALILERDIYNLTLPRRSKDQAEVVKKIGLNKLAEGDLIFFSFGGNEVDHVGVYLKNDFFVHASTTRGVIVDDLKLPVYQQAIVKTGTLN